MLRKRLDLVDKKFGRWTVIADVGSNKWGQSQFLCRCDCGTEKIVVGSSLKNSCSQSCGCLQREETLVGEKFSRLTVIKYDHKKGRHHYYQCLCVCGELCVVRRDSLISGHTESCGCFLRERASETHKGKKLSKETKRKIGESEKGPLNSSWKGGISSENNLIRNSVEYKEWRKAVYERDHYTCQMCGKKSGGDICAHHIYPFGEYPGRRFRIWNGITLCQDCHELIRGKEDQFIEQFLKITLRRPKKIILTERTFKCQ